MIPLTTREEETMQYFWTHGSLFVRELQQLHTEPRPHVNTLSTFVRLLEEKGYVGHESMGSSHRYFALITEEEYRRVTLKSVIKKYFANSYRSAVSTLIQDNALSVEEVRQLLDEVEALHRSDGASVLESETSSQV